MSAITNMEKAAAKVLEFNNFNQSKQDAMVADMNYCYKGKYGRQQRKDLFKMILDSTAKKQAILEHIEERRRSSHVANIASVMSDKEVERVIAEQSHENNDAIKHWYYTLYPSFSPTQIKERHEDAMASISQREIDQYENGEELMVHAEHWMEYYDFNLSDFEMEIAEDLFRSMVKSKYCDLTVRMCLRALKNVYNDQTQIRLRIESTTKTPKELIQTEELEETLEKITSESDFDEGSPEQKEEFVKEVFMNNWDDYALNDIKEQAQRFYTEFLEIVESDSDDDDVPESVVIIDSDDSDEIDENEPSSSQSKKIRIK